MSDDHRPVRRGLALGVGLVFAATLGALVLAPNLASARGSTRDSLTHMDASVQSITEKLSHGNFAFWDDHAHHHGPLAGVDAVQKTADLTGTTEADVKAALQGGATLAGFAADHGVSENDLVGAIVADASAHIDQAVTDEKLTQSQADDLKSGLNDRVTTIVEQAGGLPWTGHGRRSDRFLDHGAAIDTTASLTGTTSDDVRAALEGGQSLAAYAEAHGVTSAALVDGIVAAESARIDQAVSKESLTQQQADELKSGLNERVTEQVNRTGDPGGWPDMQRKEWDESAPTQST